MTDRPMDAGATEHPEEGLIHAWLDDALGAAEAERLAAHVRECAECQARVAEARGLIAGASRIVAALDDAPAGARPGWAQAARVESGAAEGLSAASSPAGGPPKRSLWRSLRMTPGRAALAATILVALGITLTHDRVSEDSLRSVSSVVNPRQTDVPASTPAEGGFAEGAKEGQARDELLDSAVARSVAAAQGRPKMEAARGPSIPQAPPPSVATEVPTGANAERVALGRSVAEAQRETSSVAADRLRVGNQAGAAAGASVGALEPRSQTRVPARTAPAAEDAMMAKQSVDAGATTCVRIDSPDADARWADQPFPLVLAVEPGPADGQRNASVLTVAGQPTQLRATWRPRDADSVSIGLRRIGYSGSIVLGPSDGSRSGVAVSASAPTALRDEAPAAAAPSAQSRARADGAREEARKAVAAPQPAPAPGPPLRELRVTARTVACPR